MKLQPTVIALSTLLLCFLASKNAIADTCSDFSDPSNKGNLLFDLSRKDCVENLEGSKYTLGADHSIVNKSNNTPAVMSDVVQAAFNKLKAADASSSKTKTIKLFPSSNITLDCNQTNGAHLFLSHLDHLTLDGQNSIFHFKDRTCTGVIVKDGNFVTLKNLVLDFDGIADGSGLPYVNAVVTNTPSIVKKADAGVPYASVNVPVTLQSNVAKFCANQNSTKLHVFVLRGGVNILERLSPELDADQCLTSMSGPTKNVVFNITYLKNAKGYGPQFSANRSAALIQKGDLLVVSERHNGKPALQFMSLRPWGVGRGENNSADHIWVYSSPGAGVAAKSQKNLKLTAISIIPNPKRPTQFISSNADGINSDNAFGDAVSYEVSNSHVVNSGDDSISLSASVYGKVISPNASNTNNKLLIESQPGNHSSNTVEAPGLQIGQKLTFSSSNYEFGNATVSEIKDCHAEPSLPCANFIVTLKFDDEPKGAANYDQIIKSQETVYAFLGKTDRAANSYIHHNLVTNSYARGIYFAGIFHPVIQLNVINGTAGPGILGEKAILKNQWTLPLTTEGVIENNALYNIFSFGQYGSPGEKLGAIQINIIGGVPEAKSPNTVSSIKNNNIGYKTDTELKYVVDPTDRTASSISEIHRHYGIRFVNAASGALASAPMNHCDKTQKPTVAPFNFPASAKTCSSVTDATDYLWQ